MQGDALASGARSATFLPPAKSTEIADRLKPAFTFPCECGQVFNSAKEFSDHVHEICGIPKAG